jgi:hypothetical protein
MKHEFAFKTLYTDVFGKTFELLRCAHCDQEKLGIERPGEYGPTGPYNVYNGKDTCPTPEEIEARRAENERFVADWANKRNAELAVRRESVRLRAIAAGVEPSELPFSLEEARALYDAGLLDDGSFEDALRELGR